MHRDDINLARQLFATAMAKLEDATIVAARGQPATITRATITREANALLIVAEDVAALAAAAFALTRRIDTSLQMNKSKRR